MPKLAIKTELLFSIMKNCMFESYNENCILKKSEEKHNRNPSLIKRSDLGEWIHMEHQKPKHLNTFKEIAKWVLLPSAYWMRWEKNEAMHVDWLCHVCALH